MLTEEPANVGGEADRASFEEARAGAALEQKAHEVALAGVRGDQERRVAVLVPRVRGLRPGGEQITDGLRVTAANSAEQVGDSAQVVRAHARGPGCRLRLQEGRRGRERLVPRPREAALGALLRERPLAVPLAARLLVID